MKHPLAVQRSSTRRVISVTFAAGVVLLLAAVTTVAARIAEGEYVSRRAAVEAALDTGTVAIFRAADVKMRSADVEYRYRQESNLLYLTGINEPGVTLVLAARAVRLEGVTSNCFLLAGPEVRRSIEKEQVLRDVTVLDAGRLQDVLSAVLHDARTLYLSMPDVRFTNDWLNNRPMFLDRDVRKELEQRFSGLKVKSAAPLVARLREIKSKAEIDLISSSIAATKDGIIGAMRTSAPGLYEYQLQAALEFEMTRRGAAYVGFPSIIGSGPNSLILHYSENRRKMQDGEIVVMDVGAEMEGYSADVTRSFPVNGEFSPEQRQIYTAVLKAQEAALAAVRPGLRVSDLDRVARASLAESGLARYLTHGISHHLGLDTHDVGSLDTLRAGMVITVEPGAYIPANDTTMGPKFRGWGVRIEDDVLVTESGCTVLSSSVPKEIAEIERIMQR
jgi:Xaa-Pro aminopeptidase